MNRIAVGFVSLATALAPADALADLVGQAPVSADARQEASPASSRGLRSGLRGTFDKLLIDDTVVVRANVPAQPCDRALEDLARTMQWRLRWSMPELRTRLGEEVVDLAFEAADPQQVARLIAMLGGADATVVDTGGGADLVIYPEPGTETGAGRERLRHAALDWYQEFLTRTAGKIAADDDSVLLRRFLVAEILQEQGQFDLASNWYSQVYQLAATQNLGARALLRMAECAFELGEGALPECRRHALTLLKNRPETPEAVAALALLGRTMLQEGEARSCVDTITEYLRRGRGLGGNAPERIEVHLVLMEAHFALDDARGCAGAFEDLYMERRARRAARQAQVRIAEHDGHVVQPPDSSLFDDLTDEQRARLAFFRGFYELVIGSSEAGLLHMRQYFALSDEDHRMRPEGWVQIGQGWLRAQRYMQARGAVVQARRLRSRMNTRWARRCSETWAEVLLALGEDETVYEQLELDIRGSARRDGEGDQSARLALHLARLYHAAGQFTRAIVTLERIAERGDVVADRARLQHVEALLAQAREIGGLAGFPERALPVAAQIVDPQTRREVAALFGAVYEELGDVTRAADAWRGVLSR